MYCSNCGAPASGNFCSRCGARLGPGQPEVLLPQDWKDEIRYNVLLHFPEVRDLIARHAAQAKKGISGEQFLALADKAFAPLVGVSLGTVAAIIVPIYARIGIQTGKARKVELSMPAGKAVVAAVCSLARFGRQLKQVHQGDDGCVLEAVLPSDFRSWQGELVIAIQNQGGSTLVEAVTKIPGQLYDWGKSKQCLDQLFKDLETLVD
jgi:hypothetical protein